MVETNNVTVPKWLVDLKQARVFPFTRSEDFFYDLHEVFDLIQEQVKEDRKIYSQDWASVGLPGLVNGCLRKASRLFDLFVQDMPGKDKPEDELRDNMMVSIYAYLYYKKIVEGPRDSRQEPYIEKVSPPPYDNREKIVPINPMEEVPKVEPEVPEVPEVSEVPEVGHPELEESSSEVSNEEEVTVTPQGSSFRSEDIERSESIEDLDIPDVEEEEPEKPKLGYL